MWIAAVLLAFVASGAKTSTGLILMGICAGVFVWQLRKRNSATFGARLQVMTIMVVPIFVFVLLVFGQSRSAFLVPFDVNEFFVSAVTDPQRALVMISFPAALFASYLPRWAGALTQIRVDRSPLAYAAVVSLLAVAVSTFVFDETSLDKQWFAVSANTVLGLFAAIGLAYLWHRSYRHLNRFLILTASSIFGVIAIYLSTREFFVIRPLTYSGFLLIGAIACVLLGLVTARRSSWKLWGFEKVGFTLSLTAIPLTIVSLVSGLLSPVIESGLIRGGVVATETQKDYSRDFATVMLIEEIYAARNWSRGRSDPGDILLANFSSDRTGELSLWATSLTGFLGLASGIPKYAPGVMASDLEDQVYARSALAESVLLGDDSAIKRACELGLGWVWTDANVATDNGVTWIPVSETHSTSINQLHCRG
jgi:hypothetical protein